jgi:enoyl-CoA hydratase/carnithine racemase
VIFMGSLVSVHDPGDTSAVRVVTLGEGDRASTLTGQTLAALANALDLAEADPGVRLAVLTSGPVTFASGADVRELLATRPAQYPRSGRAACWRRLAAFSKPVIAAVSLLFAEQSSAAESAEYDQQLAALPPPE